MSCSKSPAQEGPIGARTARGSGNFPRIAAIACSPREALHGPARLVTIAAFALALALALSNLAAAEPSVPIMPVEDVKVGMRGVGRTVFKGDTIEEFGVEILGVMESARPHGDLILFRGENPILEHAGIIRGMSGSPVYIDGKLVGAVSFAYPGTKDPIGAITPIGEMIDLLPEAGPRSSNGAAVGPLGGGQPEPGSSGWRAFDQLWERNTEMHSRNAQGAFSDIPNLPGARARQEPRWFDPPTALRVGGPAGLVPLATPACMSGWASDVFGDVSHGLGALGFAPASVPTFTGGGGESQSIDTLVPGSAVGVQMIRGDADLVAIGTVTYVEGDRIVAFGHPMMQAGAVAFPMSGAWIHAVIPNIDVSMKMGSSTAPLGGIWNDRRPGIAGSFGTVPEMLPVHVNVQAGDAPTERFSYEMVQSPQLTPFFLPWTVSNSYLATGFVSGEASVRTECHVFFDGGRSITRTERIAAQAPGIELGADITLPAALLLVNPWQKVQLDSVRVEVDYTPGNASARVVGARIDRPRARVGDDILLTAEIEKYRGDLEERTFELVVPERWAGRSLQIHIGATAEFNSWDSERVPEKFIPQDLSQMIEMIEAAPNDADLSVRVYSSEPGALLRSRELPRLPASISSVTLAQPTPGGLLPISGSLLHESSQETPWVLTGGETVYLEVEGDR